MINKDFLLKNLKTPALKEPGAIVLFNEIDSTNRYLIQDSLHNKAFPRVVLARHQTAGRGRLEKSWSDQTDTALLFSLFYRYPEKQAISLMPLVVGMAVASILRQYHSEIGLKWPNDIMFRNKKLGGVLIESRFTKDWEVVIGVGINIYASSALQGLEQPAIALSELVETMLEPNTLLAALLDQLLVNLNDLMHGNKTWSEIFKSYDLLREQPVRIHTMHELYEGIALGIDANGALLVKKTSGELTRVLQATVRKV